MHNETKTHIEWRSILGDNFNNAYKNNTQIKGYFFEEQKCIEHNIIYTLQNTLQNVEIICIRSDINKLTGVSGISNKLINRKFTSSNGWNIISVTPIVKG